MLYEVEQRAPVWLSLGMLVVLAACGDDEPSSPPLDMDSGTDALLDADGGRADAPPDADPDTDVDRDTAPEDVAPDAPPDVEPDVEPPDYGYPLDDVLRLHHIQALGTHNSYHLRSEPSTIVEDWNYSFAPLDVQAGEQGVRQFELDLHWDDTLDALRVHHIPFADEESSCVRFVDCLVTLKAWSDANPGHHAVFVFMEAKDDLDAVKLDEHLDDIDAEILSVWPRRRVLTPDDVQGTYPSLADAVRAEGWPTLGASRDKIAFILLGSDRHLASYTANQTSLAGKVMFATTGLDSPIAAIVSSGNPSVIEAAHANHVIVRAKIDGTPLGDAEAAAMSRDEALAAGIHLLSSDFPVADPATGYVVQMPDGSPSRCNPITAPPECTPQAVEALPRP